MFHFELPFFHSSVDKHKYTNVLTTTVICSSSTIGITKTILKIRAIFLNTTPGGWIHTTPILYTVLVQSSGCYLLLLIKIIVECRLQFAINYNTKQIRKSKKGSFLESSNKK